jgi:hypothetical protein
MLRLLAERETLLRELLGLLEAGADGGLCCPKERGQPEVPKLSQVSGKVVVVLDSCNA